MNKKRILKYVGAVLLVILVLFLLKGQFKGVRQDNYNNSQSEMYVVPVENRRIAQILPLQTQPVSVNIIMKNTGSKEEHIYLELWDAEQKKCYGQETIAVAASGEGETIITWNIEHISLKDVSEVVLIMDGKTATDSLAVSVQNDTAGYPYENEGKQENGHLRMSVVYGAVSYWGFFLIFACALLVIVVGCIFAWEKKAAIEKLVVAIVVSCGMVIALINPLGQEPDGWVHFIRSMDVSYGNVLLPFINITPEASYMIQPENRGAIQFQLIEPDCGEGVSYLQNLKSIKFSEETMQTQGIGGYTSLFYMPQALGIFLGRTLGFSIYYCMVLSRWINLLCYAVLIYWAIKRMPLYKNLLAVVAMLPMTVYMAASCSPDAMLNGLCLLFTALCFYYAFGEKEKLDWRHVIVLGILLALLFTHKYIYVVLGLLVFLIPPKKFGTRKEYWKAFGIALLPLLVVLAIYIPGIAFPTAEASVAGEAVNAAAGDVQLTQIGYVKQNPFALIKVLAVTILTNLGIYTDMLNTLGWLNYSLNILQTIIPCFIIGVACLDTEGIKGRVKLPHKVLCFITGVGTVIVGMTGLYLMDTNANPVGAGIVLGYQTRYAIPCLLLLLLVFGSSKIENKIKGFSVKVAGCMGAFLIYTIVTLMRICY